MTSFPLAVVRMVAPQPAFLMQWREMVGQQVNTTIANNRVGKKADGTIFQSLLDSDLPPKEKAADRLREEAQTVVGAGSEITAKTLTFISFYLFRDQLKLRRLRGHQVCHPTSYLPPPFLSENIPRLILYVLEIASLKQSCGSILANILRRFEFENFETTVEDIRIARDYLVGVPEPGSKGARAVVTKVL